MNYSLSNSNIAKAVSAPVIPLRRLLLVEPATSSSVSMLEKLAVLDHFQIEKANRLESIPAIVDASQPEMLILSVNALTDIDLDPVIWLNINNPIPVVVFAHQNSPCAVKSVVAAGVCTYIVDNVAPQRLPVILDLAFERFSQMQSVSNELLQTKKKLSERKLIERAKGIIMRQKNFTEEQAYMELRKSAMNQGKTMAELARKIIVAFDTILD
jgi:response regulator NasT